LQLVAGGHTRVLLVQVPSADLSIIGKNATNYNLLQHRKFSDKVRKDYVVTKWYIERQEEI
jgi:hypothetical protein